MRGAAPACADGSSLDAEGSLIETCFSRAPHVTRAAPDPSGRALGWVEPACIPPRAPKP